MHVQYKVNPLFVIFMEFKESPNTWPRYLSSAALWQLQNLQAWRVTWLSVFWGTEGTIKSGVHFAANGWLLQTLRTGRLRAHKQTTEFSSSLGLSPSNSILPHSIADQLQKTKAYASKDDLPRMFGVITAELTLDSGTGTFQLNIQPRLHYY